MTSVFLSEFKQFLFSTQNISHYKQLSGKSALTVYNEDRSIVVFVTHDTKGKVQIFLKYLATCQRSLNFSSISVYLLGCGMISLEAVYRLSVQ